MMDNKIRMSWEAHVRFCEKLGLKCPCLLDCSSPTAICVLLLVAGVELPQRQKGGIMLCCLFAGDNTCRLEYFIAVLKIQKQFGVSFPPASSYEEMSDIITILPRVGGNEHLQREEMPENAQLRLDG